MTAAATATTIIKRKRIQGFTLLELLVVIVIIGILISFATLAIRGTNPEELIQEEASRFNQLLQLALEEGIFKGLDYGIAFTPNSYTFVYQDDQQQWQPMSDDRLLRKRELEHDIEIELEFKQSQKPPPKTQTQAQAQPDTSNTSDDDKDKLVPDVLLYSSGEIDPEFTAYFTIPGSGTSYQVNAYSDGQHEVKKTE